MNMISAIIMLLAIIVNKLNISPWYKPAASDVFNDKTL